MTNKEVKIIVDEQLLGKRQRTTIENAAIELCNKIKTNEETRKSVWPLLEKFEWEMTPSLELRPLDRIGSEPGKSGIKVLSGRFNAKVPIISKTIPSKQMIVKIAPDPSDVGKEIAEEKYEELIDECEFSEKAKNYFNEVHFARPFEYYNDEKAKMAVLWAPCSTPDSDYSLESVTDDWKYGRIKDMNMYLSAGGRYFCDKSRYKMLYKIITAIGYLETAHKSGGGNNTSDKDTFVSHYKWELRNWDNPGWAEKWRELWGSEDVISDFGYDHWPNPVKVYEKLKTLTTKPLCLGYVHGDLHPRNIVFSRDDEVKIIDFGWTRPSQHIVKDFVLLEANLRFMTLPPFLPYNSVKDFLDWIDNEEIPKVANDEINLRIDLIMQLRQIAKNRIGTDANCDIQYVVPLFLVSLGLLKHCHSADCTWAARYTVLSLAKCLVDNNVV